MLKMQMEVAQIMKKKFLEISNLGILQKHEGVREFAKELGERRILWFYAENFVSQLCKSLGISPMSKDMKFYMEGYKGAYKTKGALILKDRFNIRYILGMYYEYKSDIGIYEPLDKLKVERIAYDYFSSEGEDLSSKECAEYLEQLRAKAMLEAHELNLHEKEGYIKLKNGLYTRGINYLSGHIKGHNSITSIDTDFDREAECPQWLEFIDEVFNLYGEKEKEKAIGLLQEFMGYSLLLGNKYQKCLMLVGKPRTGKSVILNTWENILGSKNVSSVPFEELSQETKIGELLGKHINLSGELERGKKINTTLIKSLIGEDKVKGRYLYKNPFYFINGAKLVTAGNSLPHFDDISGAMLERTLILRLDNVVSPEKRDPNLKNKLSKEKKGILRWMLKGLERLTERGKFDEPCSSIEIKKEMEFKANPVAYWWNECKEDILSQPIFESLKSKTVVFKLAYESYKNFCKEEGIVFEKRKEVKEMLSEIENVSVFKDSRFNQEVVEMILEKSPQSPDNSKEIKSTNTVEVEYSFGIKKNPDHMLAGRVLSRKRKR
jgi:P4 family phage/plasmid primase-like protien